MIFCILSLLIITGHTFNIDDYTIVGSIQEDKNVAIAKRDTDTEGNVIVEEDDHQYYTSKISTNKNGWIEIDPERSGRDKDVIHIGLSKKFRYAYTVKLPFKFRYYGYPLETVMPTTGGFVYVGDLVHRRLTETQYIAPLMAEFNPSLSEDSYVYYYLDEQKAIFQWEKVHINSDFNATHLDYNKPFTFQVQLYANGDIFFAYKDVPYSPADINDRTHYVKIGLADAYYQVESKYGVTITYIHHYHAVSIDLDKITNNTEVELNANPTCMEAISCKACLTQNVKFNCSFCPNLNECSDGMGRWRHKWIGAKCEDNDVEEVGSCPSESEKSLPPIHPTKVTDAKTEPHITEKPISKKNNSGWIVGGLIDSESLRYQKPSDYEVQLCQESSTTIICAGTDTLEIKSASFSRTNTLRTPSCLDKSDNKGSLSCKYPDESVSDVISTSCNGKSSCSLQATAKFLNTIDQCPSFDKTLIVNYKCYGNTTGKKILIAFFLIVTIGILCGVLAWVIYAYRNPTTRSGLFLIKYGRFWKSNPYKDDGTNESGI